MGSALEHLIDILGDALRFLSMVGWMAYWQLRYPEVIAGLNAKKSG
jgi:hypothetical protein